MKRRKKRRAAVPFAAIFIIVIVIAAVVAAVLLLRRDDIIPATATYDGVYLIIDAGHGGTDGGAVSENGTVEATINLDVAKKTEYLLAFFGVRTKMTRETAEIAYSPSSDTIRAQKNEDQQRRIALVNGTPNAVLLSIHQNTYPESSPHGAQTLHAPNDASRVWALALQDLLVTKLDETNRRAAVQIDDDILLFKSISCPAVLVECGFLSNPREEEMLNTRDYRLKIATVIAAGYLRQRTELEAVYNEPDVT